MDVHIGHDSIAKSRVATINLVSLSDTRDFELDHSIRSLHTHAHTFCINWSEFFSFRTIYMVFFFGWRIAMKWKRRLWHVQKSFTDNLPSIQSAKTALFFSPFDFNSSAKHYTTWYWAVTIFLSFAICINNKIIFRKKHWKSQNLDGN